MLDLCKFPATLHYNLVHLKIPPPEGWPQITPESCTHFKGDYAIQVLRHLPYFDSSDYFHVHSLLIDYKTLSRSWHEFYHQDKEDQEWWSIESEVPAGWILPIAING